MTKDYQTVLRRYVSASNGPKSLTALSEAELDRKYGQILTRCLYHAVDSLSLSLYLLTIPDLHAFHIAHILPQ